MQRSQALQLESRRDAAWQKMRLAHFRHHDQPTLANEMAAHAAAELWEPVYLRWAEQGEP